MCCSDVRRLSRLKSSCLIHSRAERIAELRRLSSDFCVESLSGDLPQPPPHTHTHAHTRTHTDTHKALPHSFWGQWRCSEVRQREGKHLSWWSSADDPPCRLPLVLFSPSGGTQEALLSARPSRGGFWVSGKRTAVTPHTAFSGHRLYFWHVSTDITHDASPPPPSPLARVVSSPHRGNGVWDRSREGEGVFCARVWHREKWETEQRGGVVERARLSVFKGTELQSALMFKMFQCRDLI